MAFDLQLRNPASGGGTLSLAMGVLVEGAGGVGSGEAFGLTAVVWTIHPDAVASGEATGSPVVRLWILATPCPTGEAIGPPRLGLALSGAGGVASEEAVGTVVLGVVVCAAGVPSEEVSGVAVLVLVLGGAGGVPTAEEWGEAWVFLRRRLLLGARVQRRVLEAVPAVRVVEEVVHAHPGP